MSKDPSHAVIKGSWIKKRWEIGVKGQLKPNETPSSFNLSHQVY